MARRRLLPLAELWEAYPLDETTPASPPAGPERRERSTPTSQREQPAEEGGGSSNPDLLKSKIAEMDRLLDIVTALKDELKKHVSNGYEQPALIDVPKRTEYT